MRRYIFAVAISFLLSLLFCKLLIPALRKVKAGQNILSYVKEHKKKSGTPTMGGLAFVFAALFATALFSWELDRPLLVALGIGFSYMIVGLLDDYCKLKHKQNLGLRPWQKLVFQTVIALLAGAYLLKSGRTQLRLPFFHTTLSLGFWILPFSFVVFLGTVNAVNLTDGLDGLAAGSCLPLFAGVGVLIFLEGGNSHLSLLSFCLVGALVAYLLFNSPPASVFMGDTGSLALGGFASAIFLLSGNGVYLLIMGGVFVLSVISVSMQVIYYKATGGKRIFLMSPIHHHFQKKGYSESKISYAYFCASLLLCLIALI